MTQLQIHGQVKLLCEQEGIRHDQLSQVDSSMYLVEPPLDLHG